MGTYEGLAPCLFGENTFVQQTAATDFITLTGAASQSGDFLVCEDSSGNELVWINKDGCIYSRGTTVSATAYLGIDARGIVGAAGTGTWYATAGFRITSALATVEACQQYALNVDFRHTGTNPGGRNAGINIRYTFTASSSPAAATSFINFEDVNAAMPTFITLSGSTSACFEAIGTVSSTHGLVIYVGTTKYWIMVSSSTA